jgi:hypothetical protein
MWCFKRHRLVCDSWLQLEFPLPEAAMLLLLKAAVLRTKWEHLLSLRLEGNNLPLIFIHISFKYPTIGMFSFESKENS